MQKRRDPVMEVFDHHENIVEIRRVIAKKKPRFEIDPKKLLVTLIVVAGVAVFWFCFAVGVWELFT